LNEGICVALDTQEVDTSGLPDGMHIFIPKIPGTFWNALEWIMFYVYGHTVYFLAILVYFSPFWHALPN
jgi:hypothetical protein